MGRLRELRSRMRHAAEMSDYLATSRRYFVLGAFDGALTIMGVILGAYTAGQLSKSLVISAGLAAGIAISVSSFVGAYEAERIESGVNHRLMERAMLREVGGVWKLAMMMRNYVSAFANGISPLIAAFVPLIPFLLMPEEEAMVFSIVITLGFLFSIGALLGGIGKRMMVYTGLRFVVAGLATAIILFLIGGR